ncbi:MAG: CRISPR-associated protein Cas4 [Moorellales bacterium]
MEGAFQVIGSWVQAYYVCPRQVWLQSRQICPDEDNVYLELGRLTSQTSYGRERREVHFGHLAIDLVRRGDHQLVVGEVKHSSRAHEAARMQLAFYLYELRQMGIEAEGELLFPEERRRERVVLDEELSQKVEETKRRIAALVAADLPPPPQRHRFCGKCAYLELCWA